MGKSSSMSLDINHLGGHEFEDLVERLLIKMGFSTEGRKPSADGGIDIIAVSSKPMLQGRYVIQCKRYTSPVSVPIIRELYGVVNSTDANKGILITTSRFTSDAIEFARDKPIELIDGTKFLSLLQSNELLGTQVQSGTSNVPIAIGLARNYLVGLANRLQTELEEIDTDVQLDVREFGRDRDRKTYEAYLDFTQRAFTKWKNANDTLNDLASRFNLFLHSTHAAPETAKRLSNQLQETVEFLLTIYREITKSRPPSAFGNAHGILKNLMFAYIADVLSFIRQLEDTLVSGEGIRHLTLHLKIDHTRTNEFVAEFKRAWKGDLPVTTFDIPSTVNAKPSTGLRGSFELDEETINEEVGHGSPGVYALGYKKENTFLIQNIGRSDTDVHARLKEYIGKYDRFKYAYADSSEAAFIKECNLYHAFSGPEGKILHNKNHPEKTKNTTWLCPKCGVYESQNAAVAIQHSPLDSQSSAPIEVTKYCRSCGTKNSITDKFCQECGTVFNFFGREGSAQQEKNVIEATRCHSCGTSNPETSRFCQECGAKIAEERILQELRQFDPKAEVKVISENHAIVRVDNELVPALIGKNGATIAKLKEKLGIKLDVESSSGKEVQYEIKEVGNRLDITFGQDLTEKVANVYVDDEYLFSAPVGKKSQIRIDKKSELGKTILRSIVSKRRIRILV
jgi:hypothetical protein